MVQVTPGASALGAHEVREAFERVLPEAVQPGPQRVETRGVEVIDRIMAGVEPEKNLQLLEDLCETMLQGSLCGLGGMTPFPVRSALKHFRNDFLRQ